MKNTLITFALLTIAACASATVRTVNNNGGAQFIAIDAAVLASSPGDTVYVCGSATAYVPATTVKNNITFIGTGFFPQKQNPVKSTITSGLFNIGNNNKLIGLVINSNLAYANGTTDLTVERCYGENSISGSGVLTNFTMNNCVWKDILFNGNNVTNALITHSVFYFTGSTSVPFVNWGTPGNVLVDYCTFIQPTGGASNVLFNPPVSGFTFNNNVFFNSWPHNTASYTYNYNMAAIAVVGSTNIASTAWPFQETQGNVTGAFNYFWNLNVLSSSPAHNASADGNDMGIYGGIFPFQSDGEPAIPQIDVMTTTGTQFAPGSSMQIHFQSSVQD